MKQQYLEAEGQFKCIAHQPERGWIGETTEKKTPYIAILLEVDDDPEDKGKLITWYGYLSDKAIEGTIERLVKTFGFDGDLNGLYQGSTSFEGMTCEVETQFEIGNDGKRRLRAKWLNPVGYQNTPEPMDRGSVAALLARINGKAKAAALAAKSVYKAPTPVAAPKKTPDDDTMPF